MISLEVNAREPLKVGRVLAVPLVYYIAMQGRAWDQSKEYHSGRS